VIQNNSAHIRTIKPGVTEGGVTQVQGVNPGEVLANSSFDKLQDNVPVVIANQPNQPPTTNPSGSNPK
jgi:multidrug efflux system membrane fusion protein